MTIPVGPRHGRGSQLKTFGTPNRNDREPGGWKGVVPKTLLYLEL